MFNTRTITGGVAGNLTVTGIQVGDRLTAVQPVSAAGANLASEFKITAANTINNTGGTNTTGMTLLVIWQKGAGAARPGTFNAGRRGRWGGE